MNRDFLTQSNETRIDLGDTKLDFDRIERDDLDERAPHLHILPKADHAPDHHSVKGSPDRGFLERA